MAMLHCNADRSPLSLPVGRFAHDRPAPGAWLVHRPFGLETPAWIVYIGIKFLVGMTKSGSTRSRSFLLPAARKATDWNRWQRA